MAYYDFDRQHPALAFADGTAISNFSAYTDLLWKRYGIASVRYALSGNRRAEEAWVRGYNEIAIPKIESKWGTNILKQTLIEVQKIPHQ